MSPRATSRASSSRATPEPTRGGDDLAVARLGPRRDPLRSTPSDCAPRLVALHGGPGLDHHLLRPLATRLAPSFECWLPDLPGHGASQLPSGRIPGLVALVERTGRWLSRNGGAEVLLGHSMGAFVALELVRLGKARPRALVLVSPPAPGRPRGRTALRRVAAAIAGQASRDARADLLAHLAEECGGDVPAEMAAAVERARLRPVDAYTALVHNLQRRLTAPLRPCDPGCPTLVLCGEEDRTTPQVEVARLTAAISGARLETIPGAGHYPWAGREDAVGGRLRELMLGLLRRPAAG